ncbi:MAG: LysR family transcriptional regulator [Gammaproteobacteria bacterium]
MDMPHLTLRQMRVFAAVAQAGSTAAAAQAIALSQSATSSALNELERLLGLRLFDRNGKRLVLNDDGRRVLPRALALLDAAADIERLAHDGGDADALALRIGASTTLGNHVLPALLRDFLGAQLQAAPAGWQARVRIGNTEAICEAVAAFELDVGLIEGPNRLPALASTPWLQDEMVLVAAPGTFGTANNAARVPTRRLRESLWLLREPGSGTREVTDQLLLPHLGAHARSLEMGSSEAIQQAAVEGLGVACLSRWVVQEALAAGRLVALQTALPPLRRQCHLVLHRHKQPTRALSRFWAMALARAAADHDGAR